MRCRQERPWRTGLKPLDVIQREGPSFSVDGHHVRWQKWDFRISFNYREGLVFHNIGCACCASIATWHWPCTCQGLGIRVYVEGIGYTV